ncbi:hypothetical protein BCR37DRAFT_110015 [Protomyces lactucae-debilis]|uniref:HOOK N-terminal domain-containing protein n=1 Tax=Protomyces lactucae-debilis TaxID=2754530 RepID=A0A1Y2F593_PROLT|nr:uncharacterized protein BCR37DRAFT_110015 [Protomyces lactucae-debilis]ORY78654.1 hypothetical protein BCR37DRAFT_110015 [Protomyces lactucae-debilis]
MADAAALLHWLQQLYPHASLDTFADGSLLCTCLFDIDPNAFSTLAADRHTQQSSTTWVLRLNKLKRAFKLMQRFLKETGGIQLPETGITPHLPNLQRIAKDGAAASDLTKLLRLVLVVAVQSPRKDVYVDAIALLNTTDQTLLTQAIEDVQQAGRPTASTTTLQSPTPASRRLASSSTPGPSSHEAQISALQRTLSVLTDENAQLKTAIAQVDQEANTHATEGITPEQALLQHQYTELKRFLEQAEVQITTLEEEREEQAQHVTKLERRLAETGGSAQHVAKLLEDVAEMEGIKEQYRRVELVNDKYKRKLEAMTEMQQKLKESEERATKQEAYIAELEKQTAGSKRLQEREAQLNRQEAHMQELKVQHAQQLQIAKEMLNKSRVEVQAAEKARIKAVAQTAALAKRMHLLEETSTQASTDGTPLSEEMTHMELSAAREQLDACQVDIATLKKIIASNAKKEAALQQALIEAQARCVALESDSATATNLDTNDISLRALYAERSKLQAHAQSLTIMFVHNFTQLELVLNRLPEGEREQIMLAAKERVQKFVDKTAVHVAVSEELERTKEELTVAKAKLRECTAQLAKHDAARGGANTAVQALIADLTGESSKDARSLSEQATYYQNQLAKSERQVSLVKPLLRQQNDLIRSLRVEVETARSTAGGEQVATLQAALERAIQETNQVKQEARETEAILRQENVLVARAFYDLSSRLTQSNLSLQRTRANPRSFLAQQRQLLEPAHRA